VEKLLPQNIEAECGVLGSLIIDPEAIVQVANFLRAEDFYRDAHRILYQVIIQLYEQRKPADFITICDVLEQRNKIEDAGSASYIASLINQVPTSGNVEYYGRIVERTAILRRLIHAAGQIAATAYEAGDAEVALDKAEQLIFEISQHHTRSDFSTLGDLLCNYMEKLEQLHQRRGTIVGVPTGFADLDRLTGGLQRSDLLILAARPAVGKCAHSNTLIDDPKTGARLTIAEYVKRRLSQIHSLSAEGKIHIAEISAWIDSGIKPCYRVRTESGRIVEVTGHHPFLTVQGWLPLHDLKVGQHIAVPTAVPAFGSDESWPLEHVRLLAYFLAEGGSTHISPMFTHTNQSIAEDFKHIVTTCYPSCALKQERSTYAITQPKKPSAERDSAVLPTNPIITWLSELGLMGKLAKDKFFPPCVWQWSRRYLAEFLRALMSCNGSIYPHPISGVPAIEFSVASKQLAADLYHAILRFGIVSKFYQKTKKCWTVLITTPEYVKRYQDEIGWLIKRAKALEDPISASNSSSAIYWDEIISIESIGEHQVYDLTVPDHANFIAQDIFVHNTSFALSLAYNAAVKQQYSVAVFSLEMSKEQLLQRFLSMATKIDQQRLRTGWIEDDEWERIIDAMGMLSEAKIWIDDTAGISTMEMRSKARRLITEHGLDLVIVDYLQLMQSDIGGKRNDNRVQEVAEISRNLKGLARELNVPVLALAQLSRSVESRQSKVPQLSDLRESGCLAGETPVYLPDEGISRPIEQLVGRSGFRVLALNTETWQLEPCMVTNAFSTGYKSVYKMATHLGHTVRATACHKFLTIQGWKRLDELQKSDCICVPRHLPGPTCALSAQSDLVWDGVLSIEPAGEEAVYDLTVEKLHNFIANNIVLHNSIEQDADLVMFIYRDEVYNPDTERKNIADIIVAKHRNGPVGEVSLFFQASQTCFADLAVSPPADE
jgi:replicative DNA helicase